MKKMLLVIVLAVLCLMAITSCSTSDSQKDFNKQIATKIFTMEGRVRDLKKVDILHAYFFSHSDCFIGYLMCKDSKNKSKCWARHEQCVINVHNMYKDLLNK